MTGSLKVSNDVGYAATDSELRSYVGCVTRASARFRSAEEVRRVAGNTSMPPTTVSI